MFRNLSFSMAHSILLNCMINDNHRRGFSVTVNRECKAKKIVNVISEFSGGISGNLLLLDIGTGNGGIAHHLGENFNVISVDIEDQRLVHDGYSFLVCNEKLPFMNEQFDIVISNHIIEHVSDHRAHLFEIARVLKSNGLVYLATPNRLWPWEVHYKVPIIHYLPPHLFKLALKLLKKYREDIHLFSWKGLSGLVSEKFVVHVYSDKICSSPSRYFMKVNPLCEKILQIIPPYIYTFLTLIHPTLVVVMQKKNN